MRDVQITESTPPEADGIPPFLVRTKGKTITTDIHTAAMVVTAELASKRRVKSSKLPVPPQRVVTLAKPAPTPPAASSPPAVTSKTQLVASMLRRPEGCTTAEVLAATGWPAVSMPAMAKAAKITMAKEKTGKVTRYYAE